MAASIMQVAAQSFPMDYSYCGYKMSEQPVPDAPVRMFVPHRQGDNAARIQAAIDHVSSLKPDSRGLRGAVLLDRGTFELTAPLRLPASGVVLRGMDRNATILYKKGVDRGAVIYVEGQDHGQYLDTLHLQGEVPLGSRQLPISPGKLKPGSEVMVWRPSSAAWIDRMGCSHFGGGPKMGYWGWRAGEIDVTWTRRITTVSANGVTLDAPLSMTLHSDDDARLIVYRAAGRVENSGVEHLTIASDHRQDNPMDEDHAWDGVYIAHARDCWVRMVNFRHLAGSAVVVQRSGSQMTIEDCKSLQPISEIGGMRRRTFLVLGEKCLFQRCYSEHGINDFAAGLCAAGPNAFVQCDSRESWGFSGSVGPWATGLLFDVVNIDGNDLKLCNLGLEKYGTGWNTANSLAYQCTASGIYADSLPDGSYNEATGCWAQFSGNGRFSSLNDHLKPWSIFEHQLSQRLGRDVSAQCRTMPMETREASSPTIEQALEFARMAHLPRPTISDWIDRARLTAGTDPTHIPTVDRLPRHKQPKAAPGTAFALTVREGRLLLNDTLMTGIRYDAPWWNGRVRYATMDKAPYGVTRFVPGYEGRGGTDRIDSVAAAMQRMGVSVFHQNYGLWYDRRRDDHERVRRRDGDVWAPFYEQAFARSGQGKAWDGLSRYDLTRLNAWYFHRLRQLAGQGAAQGMIILNEHYFQHNILEAGAHWVDCPWRTANNINRTSFPEPVPFASDKRIFMADYFYNTADTALRRLHQQYIMQQLDALSDQPNVVHSIGEEFTGTADFVRLWLATIRQWERQTGKNALVCLTANRDVQDSIMADPEWASLVDIIGIQQWYYHSKGLYAPQGGVSMAPRQYTRKIRVGRVDFEHVYASVTECRNRYPSKPVFYYGPRYPEMAWAVLLAGGSCPAVRIADPALLQAMTTMQPAGHIGNVYLMQPGNERGALVWIDAPNTTATLTLAPGHYRLHKIDPRTGQTTTTGQRMAIQEEYEIGQQGLFWLQSLE